jgi:hypothetical protein
LAAVSISFGVSSVKFQSLGLARVVRVAEIATSSDSEALA